MFTCVVLFGTAFCSPVRFFWSLGDFGVDFSTDSKKFVSGQIELGEIFLMENKTNLYLSISPFYTALSYSYDNDRNNELSQWSLSSLDFVNLKFGWFKPFGKYFLLEPFVRLRTLNPLEIKQFNVECAFSFSFILPELFVTNSVFESIGKIVELEVGADFIEALAGQAFCPKCFIAIKINFMCLSGLKYTF